MSDVSQSLCVLELFSVSFCASLQSRCELVKLLTALLIGSCGRLSQITCNASLSWVIDLDFGWNLSWVTNIAPQTRQSMIQANLEATDRF